MIVEKMNDERDGVVARVRARNGRNAETPE